MARRIIRSNGGFSLVELLLYSGIFAVVGSLMTGVLFTVTKVGQQAPSAVEVSSQINLVMQTINRLIKESSAVMVNCSTSETVKDNDVAEGDVGCPPNGTSLLGAAQPVLRLRMKDSVGNPTDRDPIVIWKDTATGAIKMKEGLAAATDLTTNRVVTDKLEFRKFTNYPGHDTISIDLQLSYNTQNPSEKAQQYVQGAVSRVSAATFDSPLLPGGQQDVGFSGTRWNNLYVQNADISGSVGIGVGPPSANTKLEVAGDIKIGPPLSNNGIIFPDGTIQKSAAAGGAAVSSVSNSDGTLNISPSTGAVIASLNLTKANTWTGAQTFNTSAATFNAGANFPGSGIWNTSGNVGIGTANPAAGFALDVVGNTKSKGVHVEETGTNHPSITVKAQGTGNSQLKLLDPLGIGWLIFNNNGASDRLEIGNMTSDTTYDTARLTIESTGNISIGTVSPGAKLTVNTNSTGVTPAASTIAHFIGGNTSERRLLVDSFVSSPLFTGRKANGTAAAPSALISGNEIVAFNAMGYGASGYSSGSRAALKINAAENWTDAWQGTYLTLNTTAAGSTAETERVRVSDSGNVGIGNTSPSQKLDVSGTVKATGLQVNVGAPQVGQILTAVDTSGTVAWQAAQATGVQGSGTANYITKWTTGNQLTNSVIYDSGSNVGIGTSNPQAKLHIETGDTNEVQIRSANTYIIERAFNTSPKRGEIGVYDASIPGWGNLVLQSNGGNVGIGNTSPSQKLDVSGTVKATGLQVNVGAPQVGQILTAVDTSGTVAWQAAPATGVLGSGTADYLPIWLAGGTSLGNSAIAQSGSNVGIGTASPSQKLDVVGTIQAQNSDFFTGLLLKGTTVSSTRSPNLQFQDNQATSQSIRLRKDGAGLIVVGTDLVTRAQIGGDATTNSYFNSGNVGIGNTGPNYKLDVSGDINATNFYKSGVLLATLPSGTANQTLRYDSINGWVADGTISNDGSNIGIGNSSPATKLDVSGQITTRGGSAGITVFDRLGGGSSFLLSSPSAGVFKIIDQGSGLTRLEINASGQVGIGASPSYKLDVSGDVRWTGTLQGGGVPWARLTSFPAACGAGQVVKGVGSSLTCVTDATGITVETDPEVGTLALNDVPRWNGTALTSGLTTDDGATLNINGILQTTDGAYLNTDGAQVGLIVDSGIAGIGTTSPGTGLAVKGAGAFDGFVSANYFTSTSTKPSWLLGNLGIGVDVNGVGVTNPATPIETVGAIQAHDSGTTPSNIYQGLIRVTRSNTNTAQYINLVRSGSYPWSIGMVYNSNTFAIGTGQTIDSNFTSPQFAMTTAGNVGLGTVSPSTKLHVVGGVRIADPGLASCDTIDTDAAGNLSCGTDSGGTVGPGTINKVAKFTGTGTTVGDSNIFDNGTNVGIGTAAPAATIKLHVKSTETYQAKFEHDTDYARVVLDGQTGLGSNLRFEQGGIPIWGLTNYGNDIGLFLADNLANGRFIVRSSGNVGIGDGTGVLLPANLLELSKTTGGDPAITFDIQNVNKWTIGVDASDADKLKFETGATLGGATPPLVLTTSGNVGIGTTNPNYKLAVVGNVNISGTITGATRGFGGMYQTDLPGSTCRYPNPLISPTPTCSCPSGFTATQVGKFCNTTTSSCALGNHDNLYMCWK